MKLIGKTKAQVESEILNQAIESARNKRNKLLAECDWTQVADAPVDKLAWAKYRQALRDLPLNEDWPEMEWPRKL
ncbi:MAG: hypothetical protein C0436_00105 [Alphaproteobacteria bacterium]|nr:hypothetical protein [Alphaproteobacteria bacterium]